MNKIKNIITICLFLVLVFGILLASLLTQDKESSVLESKTLAVLPEEVTFDSYLDRSLANSLENYCNDQLVLRDRFMELYSDSQRILGRKILSDSK